MSVKVTAIPARKPIISGATKTITKGRRVAAYARVSTATEEQATSYEAQVAYYTELIENRADWEMAGIYTDEGITGTSTKHRDGFKQMISDALAGKIDLIVTKSVSRFARNTVDSLTTVRKLKEKGVEIFFEKENIWTLDSKGELLITIMSSLAQEESRSISENVRWGVRKRFADGRVALPYPHFLGYDKGPDGRPVINEKEAEVVRKIYRMYLSGYSLHAIARTLGDEQIPVPVPRGKKWYVNTVKSILQNEKYKGDALLQKTYIADFLTKKQVKNKGEVTQYYVTGSHEAIIDPETWELVQYEIKRRKRAKKLHAFTHMFVCEHCGSFYGSKTWHSNQEKYKTVVWQCNNKFDRKHPEKMPHPTTTDIEEAFLKSLQIYLQDVSGLIATLEQSLERTFDTSESEKQLEELAVKIEGITSLMNKEVERNSRAKQDQQAYRTRFSQLEKELETASSKFEALNAEIEDKQCRKKATKAYIKTIQEIDERPIKFDRRICYILIDHGTINPSGKITFYYKDGTQITV